MPDPTDPKPPGMPGLPGCKDITVTVTRCDNGNPISNFIVSNAFGNPLGGSYYGGYFVITCAVPGLKFRVGALGYDYEEHTLTAKEITAQFATVCLNETIPPPKPPGPRRVCPIMMLLVDTDDGRSGVAALEMYDQFRVAISLTPVGKLFSRRFSESSAIVVSAFQKDTALALSAAVLLLRIQPHISALMRPRSIGYGCGGDCDQPRITQDILDAVETLMLRLNKATAGALEKDLKSLGSIRDRAVGLTISEALGLPLQPLGHDSSQPKKQRPSRRKGVNS